MTFALALFVASHHSKVLSHKVRARVHPVFSCSTAQSRDDIRIQEHEGALSFGVENKQFRRRICDRLSQSAMTILQRRPYERWFDEGRRIPP